jgi:hypothetical protein
MRVYRLYKACAKFERKVDRFQAGGKKQRSAHPILWIYLDFSTAQMAKAAEKPFGRQFGDVKRFSLP